VILRRDRFGDLVRRQLDLFDEDEADLLQEAVEAERRYDEADGKDAEEAYGDLQLVFEDLETRLRSCGIPTPRRSRTMCVVTTSARSTGPRPSAIGAARRRAQVLERSDGDPRVVDHEPEPVVDELGSEVEGGRRSRTASDRRYRAAQVALLEPLHMEIDGAHVGSGRVGPLAHPKSEPVDR
jgi:hypothetical protein